MIFRSEGSNPTESVGQSSRRGEPGCCLFVNDIPIAWTDLDLAHMFEPFATPGKMLSVTVHRKRKGFGFVNYDNPTSAQNAITAMHGMQVAGGKCLKVEMQKQNRIG